MLTRALTFLALVVVLAVAVPLQDGTLRMISPFRQCGQDPNAVGMCLSLDQKDFNFLASLKIGQAVEFTSFPMTFNTRGILRLVRFSVVEEADGGNPSHPASVVLLHGGAFLDESSISNSEDSFLFAHGASAFLALSPHGSNGMFQSGNRTFILSTPWESFDNSTPEIDEYVSRLSQTADAALGTTWRTFSRNRASVVYEATNMNIPLSAIRPQQPLRVPEGLDISVDTNAAPRDPRVRYTFRVASDVDYDMYRKKGSNYDATASFYSTLIGATNSIYARDFASGLSSSYMKIYTSQDGYPCCSSSQALDYMRRTWSTSTPSRSLAALVSAKNLGGGIAYLRTLCNLNYAYAINGNMQGYFPTPVRNYDGQNWDIYVFAHEVGHVFGAPHTHEMSPPVDNCGNTPGCGATRGTIMSYCHLCSGGLSNVEMAFHSRTVSEVRGYIDRLAC